MKWKVYSTPDFTKILFSRIINGDDGKYRTIEPNMYVFTEFMQRQLNKTRKIEAGKVYTFSANSKKENASAIFNFAQFYIRAVQDPLNGICAYADDRVCSKASELEIKKTIKNEVFIYTNVTGDEEIDKGNIHSLAFKINAVGQTKDDEDNLEATVTVEIVSYV